MKLASILEQLTFGELKQLGIGGFSEGAVQPESYKELTSHLNLALLNLYTRFPVKEKEFSIRTQLGKDTYLIDKAYTFSFGSEDWYINDEKETFLDDILRINVAFNSEGTELPINDEARSDSVFIPSYNSIQILSTEVGEYHFIYRARPLSLVSPYVPKHPTGAEDYTTFLNQEVEVPEVLLEALFTYVAYRAHKSTGGETSVQLAQVAKQDYESMCFELEKRNVLNNAEVSTNIKSELGGWI